MKRSQLIFWVLSAACALACTREAPDTIENEVYFDRESVDRVSELTVNIHDTYAVPLPVRVPVKAADDIKLHVGVDASLVEEFNHFYGEKAELLPSEYYYFDRTNTVISKGTVYAPDNSLHFEGILSLDPDKVFVLPVTVKSAAVPVLSERAVNYYVLRRTGIISVVGNLDNNGTGVYAKVNWTDVTPVKNPTGFTYEALLWCTFTSDGLVYDESRKNYPRGHESMYIMTLLGADHTTGAIQIRYYLNSRPGYGGRYWFELANFNRKGWGGSASQQEGEHPDAQPTSDQFTFYPDRTWFHWAVTFDKASGVINWYCDGKLVSTKTLPASERNFEIVYDAMHEDGTDLKDWWYIGHSNSDNQRWWAGKISELRIWNRALSAEEINSDNHFYYVDPEHAPGLASYWKFNEGNGGIIHDYSGYGNHATVISDSPILWEKVDLPER